MHKKSDKLALVDTSDVPRELLEPLELITDGP